MPKASASTPFRLFEQVVINLYDGGVLSPAVLERVIGAFAQAGADWHSALAAHSVDDRSLHEIVVRTMLPADALESAEASFIDIVEHIAGASRPARAANAKANAKAKAKAKAKTEAQAEKAQPARTRNTKPADADEESGSEELLAQLSGSAQPDKRRRSDKTSPPGRSNSFNPFLNAALPRTKKS